MGFELGTDYFKIFDASRDSHLVIYWDDFNDRFSPLYFKSEDGANQYLREHIKELSDSEDAASLLAIKGCCIAAITQAVKIDYVITGGKNNGRDNG